MILVAAPVLGKGLSQESQKSTSVDASAQTGNSAESNADQPSASGGDIVVTGIRQSLESAIAIKRNADTVVDAINAEDVGKFPDANVAESVQRITGVQINRTRGEGRSVNIRGLPAVFTFTTLNGQALPNAISNTGTAVNRTFDFSILPSEFIRTLLVYKEATADLQEGGLAGTVDIRTPRPFDFDKTVLTGSAQADWESKSGKYAPRLALFYSGKTKDGRLGLSMGVAYNRDRPETDSANMNYTSQTEGGGIPSGSGPDDLNGDGVIEPDLRVRIPAGTIYNLYSEDRKRLSAMASLEFKPTDSLTLHADGFFSEVDVLARDYQFLNIFNNATNVVSSGISVTDLEGLPTATRFQVDNLDLRANNRDEDRHGDLRNLNLGATWKRNGWTVDVEGALSQSKQRSSNLALANTANGSAAIAGDVGSGIVQVTYLNGFDQGYLDPDAYRVLSLNGEFHRHTVAKYKNARFDVTRDFDDGFLRAIRFGGMYDESSAYQDNNNLTVQAAGVSQLYGGLPAGPIANSYSAAPFMEQITAGNGDFLDGYSGDGVFPTLLMAANTRAFVSQFSDSQLVAAGKLTNDATGISDVHERTLAGYARADFGFGNVTGNIGLRVVKTWQRSVGVSPDLSGITVDLTAGYVTHVPASEPLAVKRSYTDFLPSVNFKWQAAPDLDVRLSASRTMTRPNLTDIAPTTTANANGQTITEKNPYLDPFRSDNVDLGVSWYFARGASLGATLFYKHLETLIRNETNTEDLPVTFIEATGTTQGTIEFHVNSLQNGKGVDVKGVEAYYQQDFTFLPHPFDGLGALLNYTFIDNSDPKQLTAASRNNFNATVYYEKGPISTRLSYTWRDGFLTSPQSGFDMGVEAEPFGTLDGSFTIDLSRRFSVVLEGSNLTDATEKLRYTTGIPNLLTDTGRRLLFGVRFKM